MDLILGVLNFALFIALILGLIKPSNVLRWSTKPTRLKVFGFWLLTTFLVTIIRMFFISEEEVTKNTLESAQNLIEEGQYSEAVSLLKEVEIENTFYPEAQRLIVTSDSLYLIDQENKRILAENKAKKAAENERSLKVDKLGKALSSIEDGVDFSVYRGTIESLQMELLLFSSWSKTINNSENEDDSELQNLANKLKAKVVAIQIKEFPALRKEYARIVNKKMWENDIEVTLNGNGNKYINFSGGVFAANKNKQTFQNELHEILNMFRFNQSRYRWYKNADEYTYYTIYEGKDSDLVTFDQ